MRARTVVGVTTQVVQHEDKPPLAKLDQEGPLEVHEQEEVLSAFEDMQLSSARTWRASFGCGALLLAGFWAWSAWQEYQHPWGQRITGELRASGTHSDAMALALLGQALTLVLCGVCMLNGMPGKGARERGCLPAGATAKLLLAGAGLGSLLCCLFWLHVHWEMRREFGVELGHRNHLLWVPLAPVGYVALCWWVLGSLATTGAQVLALKKLKFQYHSA